MKWKEHRPSELAALIKAGRPIYVLNTSNFGSGRGHIIINFIDGTRKRHFEVPDTFIPLNITDSIPADQLTQSHDFLDLLKKQIITLVDGDQAAEFLASEEASEEYDALVLSRHSSRAHGVELEASVKRSFSSKIALTADMEEAMSDADVSPRVRAKVDELTAGAITAKEMLAECKRNGESFTEVDLHFIQSQVKDIAVGKWIDSRLMDISGDMGKALNKAKSPTPTRAVAKASGKGDLSKAFGKKASKAGMSLDDGDDEPTSDEEAAELAKGMAKAASQQNISGRVPDDLITKVLNR